MLTTELIEGIPLIDIVIACRDNDRAYLETLAEAGHDLDRIVRRLDWNMLNQVFVFGYFHADLHPANIFVLPDDAIGYVDFGIVGQLPNRVRDSLTPLQLAAVPGRRGGGGPRAHALARAGPDDRLDAAPVAADPHPPGVPVRHGRRAGRGSTEGAPGPTRDPAENPYSRLAVDILATIRVHELTLSRASSPT